MCRPDDPRLDGILALIQRSFAYMEGRIDPPSSMKSLTRDNIADQCTTGEVWVIGDPPLACMFLRERNGRLYLGKLAVDATARGKGLARTLVAVAHERALKRGLRELELEVRIELTENHTTFAALGFTNAGTGAHPGYDRPTFLTMRRILDTPDPQDSHSRT